MEGRKKKERIAEEEKMREKITEDGETPNISRVRREGGEVS